MRHSRGVAQTPGEHKEGPLIHQCLLQEQLPDWRGSMPVHACCQVPTPRAPEQQGSAAQ